MEASLEEGGLFGRGQDPAPQPGFHRLGEGGSGTDRLQDGERLRFQSLVIDHQVMAVDGQEEPPAFGGGGRPRAPPAPARDGRVAGAGGRRGATPHPDQQVVHRMLQESDDFDLHIVSLDSEEEP